eukprot:Phypoly_transcript_09598.p1 GENE.Phypoly_transcript_09598~~Phypoly_transcript_09598.p1  ORF type:complete len:417 (+),score=88.26 Phypoly_transcript_09598:96-1346(+)
MTTYPPLSKDPSFDPSAHRIIPFSDLLEENGAALQQLKQEFKTRGWCIVKFPDAPVKAKKREEGGLWGIPNPDTFYKFPISTRTAISSLSSFFAGPESTKVKTRGYSSVPHKESIHITTPDMMFADARPNPKEIHEWCELWDEVSVAFIESIAPQVFSCTQATLAHRADLPVAWSNQRGMLDIAHYLNNKTATLSHEIGFSTEDVNCVPHYDPGLLSISFLSTQEGLQLKDPQTDTWFAGPVNTVPGQENLGVIWLGEAAVTASKGEFRAGVHRVVYPQTPVSRITAWYEMCTTDQVNEEANGSSLPSVGPVKLHNLPNSKSITLTGDRRLIERHYGIPMSKSGRPFKNQRFRAAYSAEHNTRKNTGGPTLPYFESVAAKKWGEAMELDQAPINATLAPPPPSFPTNNSNFHKNVM